MFKKRKLLQLPTTDESSLVIVSKKKLKKLTKTYPNDIRGPVRTEQVSCKYAITKAAAYNDAITKLKDIMTGANYSANIAVVTEKTVTRNPPWSLTDFILRTYVAPWYSCHITVDMYTTQSLTGPLISDTTISRN